MKWYLLNTDARSMSDGRSPHEKWFNHGMAFCAEYTLKKSDKNFSDNFLKLKPGDVCLMYANAMGIIGVGKVSEEYNGRTYAESECLVYVQGADGYGKEHRIRVDWEDLRNTPKGPISYDTLRSMNIIPNIAFRSISEADADKFRKFIYG